MRLNHTRIIPLKRQFKYLSEQTTERHTIASGITLKLLRDRMTEHKSFRG